MKNFFLRHASGVVAELGQVLEARRAVIESKTFKTAVQRIDSPAAERAWRALVAAFALVPVLGAPKKKTAASKVARYFKQVRDKAAYHYGNQPNEDEVLAKGYAAKFGNPKVGDASAESAFMSLGESMTSSRFFFADAAVLAVVDDALAQHSVSLEEINSFVTDINLALRFIVGALLVHLQAVTEQQSGRP